MHSKLLALLAAMRPDTLVALEKRSLFVSLLTAALMTVSNAAVAPQLVAQNTAADDVPKAGTAGSAESHESAATGNASVKQASGTGGVITEGWLRSRLVGKPLYLRGAFLGDSISFDQHGDPIGHPAKGSFTLSSVQIDKVRLSKHKIELEGARYALHFSGDMTYEDPSKDVDRVKITPRKKVLKISIERERVEKPKREKSAGKKGSKGAGAVAGGSSASGNTLADNGEAEDNGANTATRMGSANPGVKTAAQADSDLRAAVDKVFAADLDSGFRAQLPEFWQLYFEARSNGGDYRPKDSSVVRSNAVDQQAKLNSVIAPASNDFAQANGIAGRALYRAVINSDGTVNEVAVVRPIGFGLDENAVAAIHKAQFQPAMKSGKPVAEALDLAVQFRIYSKRTATPVKEEETARPPAVPKPGPYSAKAQ